MQTLGIGGCSYSIEIYKKIAVEGLYGWLKSLRITIMYEKLAITYRVFITIAYIIIH